ncbi:MAG: glycosyltransferase family A protein [Flavipsychrobacter sp.]
MFSDWIICIFSYNRAGLLQNLLQSIAQFYPEMKVAIFDDDSDDEATVALLSQLQKQGIEVHHKELSGSSKHGGLYTMMDQAIGHAMSSSYKYAYFVQDDMQFLWRDEGLEKKVSSVFAKEECLMCNSSFLQKIFIEGIENRLPRLEEEDLYAFNGYGVADTGIINLEKARAVSLSFPMESEDGNGKYWHEKGWQMYWLPQPHLAWVPWPSTYRYKKVEHRKLSSLLPLEKESIAKLSKHKGYAYLEDYTATTNWFLKPYWYADHPGKINLLKIYLKYYLRRIIK